MRVLTTLLTEVAAQSGFPWVQVITAAVVFAVVWPLQARLRRTLSERRRARWAAEDAGTGRVPDHDGQESVG